MTKKTKAKAKTAPKPKKTAAPKLTDRQLNVLKRVATAPTAADAFDRRTLNSLAAKKLVSGTKTVSVTKAGSAYLGA
jgi:hypothetical protein